MSIVPDNADDVIDSRDVIARIEELQHTRQHFMDTESSIPWAEAEPDEAEELAALEALAQEAEGCADWPYGETLVRDSYFKDYAQQLAEDIGCLNDDDKWPYTCTDWELAARELRYDYTSVDFAGVTYWVRS